MDIEMFCGKGIFAFWNSGRDFFLEFLGSFL